MATQLSFLTADDSAATFSADRRYRYRLGSRWGTGPAVNFLMLNPSIADESRPDPTMTRCVGFAGSWGFSALIITNLYALVSTDPRELWKVADPHGPLNERHIIEAAKEARLVVCAWGNHGAKKDRWKYARQTIEQAGMRPHYIRLTKSGQPEHPLYLPGHLEPKPWEGT